MAWRRRNQYQPSPFGGRYESQPEGGWRREEHSQPQEERRGGFSNGGFSEWKRKNSEEWKELKRKELEVYGAIADALLTLNEKLIVVSQRLEELANEISGLKDEIAELKTKVNK